MRMREVLVVVMTTAVAISGIVMPGLAESEGSTINHSNMKRDIGIMENILEELLSSGQKGLLSLDQQVRGFYLENYGVIFYVPYRWGFSWLKFQPAMEGFQKGMEGFQKGMQQWVPRLQRQIEGVQEEVQKELDRQLPEIERQIEEAKHQSTSPDDKQVQEQVEETQERMQEVQKKIEKAQKQRAEVQKQTEEVYGKKAEIQKLGEEIQKRKEEMQRQRANLQRQGANLQRQRENLQRQGANLQRQRQELRTHRDEVRDLTADLTEFLGSYADTIRQLEPTDWVSVIVDMDGEYLNARATKSAISKFRKTNSDVQAFGNEIQFITLAAQGDIDRALKILSGIFETALKQTYPAGGIRVERAYLDTVGALLFIDANLGTQPAFLLGTPWDSAGTRSTGELNRNRRVQQLEGELVGLLKDYGQGLAVLRPGDAVTIVVNLGPSDEGPTMVVLKGRKSDIEAANRERISLEEFRQRVEICEY